MKTDDRDWRRLDLGDQIRCLETEGYVVFPELIRDRLPALVRGLAALERKQLSRYQSLVPQVQWSGCAPAVEMLAHPAALGFLRALFGEDPICMNCSYACTAPGYPGMSLHVDFQPYGSELFGALASSPAAIRVFYYLNGLTTERAPLRVLPFSHLSLHRDANPYRRHRAHPEEVAITCPPGSAVFIHGRLFHGVGANRDTEVRSVLTASYRPAWAGPARRVPAHDRQRLDALPPAVRALFRGPNTRVIDMKMPICAREESATAAGLGPGRWSREEKN